MNLHTSIETLQEVAAVNPEVLYATARFEVRIWNLQAGHSVRLLDAQERQCVLIKGQLAVIEDGKSFQPVCGKRFVVNATPAELNAISEVTLLELCWLANKQDVPLFEVTEERPWGSFTVLKDELDYKLKELMVNPGSRLSLQRHFKREEHWFVTQGQPEVYLDGEIYTLKPGAYIHIPLQSWHRIANPSNAAESVEIVELQLGDYFGEDDIERQQDDYGRQ